MKSKFSITSDVIFLVRLQGKFEVDHSPASPVTTRIGALYGPPPASL